MAANANGPKNSLENGRSVQKTYSANSEHTNRSVQRHDEHVVHGFSSRTSTPRTPLAHDQNKERVNRPANVNHTHASHSRVEHDRAARARISRSETTPAASQAQSVKGHQKKKRYSKRKILRFVFFLVFCVSVFMVVRMLIDYQKSRKAYDELSTLAVSSVEASEEQNLQNAADPVSTPKMITGSLPWEQQERIAAEVGITVDWEALREINKYVAAWLYCPDTNINYPVVQYKDNEYFLNRNFNRREDESGALFFDYRNILSNGRENWIIYGHRRNDKSMFGSLAKYAKEEYLSEHPVMYLLMPDQSYRVEIFSCRTVHAEQQYFSLWFNDTDTFSAYLDKAVKQSYWTPTFAPDTDYPILTLATCSTYVGDDEPRLLVHGRLVPIE